MTGVKQRLVQLLTGAALLPMLFGTSPTPEPQTEHRVRGNILRTSGGPKQNYVVALQAYPRWYGADSIVTLPQNSAPSTAVTDSSGAFTLSVRSWRVDSVRVVVSRPDAPLLASSVWMVPVSVQAVQAEQTYDKPGCAGCGTVTETGLFTSHYLADYPAVTVIVPE